MVQSYLTVPGLMRATWRAAQRALYFPPRSAVGSC
jgi:hypothetical protein